LAVVNANSTVIPTNAMSQAICALCDSGNFTAATGQAVCTQAAAGHFVPEYAVPVTYSAGLVVGNPSAQLPCSLGREQPNSGATGCITCEAGTIANATGSPSCWQCPLGTNAPAAEMSKCFNCLAGQFGGETGSAACTACTLGSFSNAAQQAACQQCPSGTTTLDYQATSGLACVCAKGRFTKNQPWALIPQSYLSDNSLMTKGLLKPPQPVTTWNFTDGATYSTVAEVIAASDPIDCGVCHKGVLCDFSTFTLHQEGAGVTEALYMITADTLPRRSAGRSSARPRRLAPGGSRPPL
jgi:hypothetical protein